MLPTPRAAHRNTVQTIHSAANGCLIGELSLVVDPYRWSREMTLQQSTLCAQVTFGILNCGELLVRLLEI